MRWSRRIATKLGDGDLGSVTFAAPSIINVVDSFTVNSGGSGGVDSTILETIAPVLLPASVVLMLAGLDRPLIFRRKRSVTD